MQPGTKFGRGRRFCHFEVGGGPGGGRPGGVKFVFSEKANHCYTYNEIFSVTSIHFYYLGSFQVNSVKNSIAQMI